MTNLTPTPPSTRTSRRRRPRKATMESPTPTPQSSRTTRRRRPIFETLPDGTRRRIVYPQPPQPPRPTPISISEPDLASLCTIWDFPKLSEDQAPSTYDRAEHLLYDTSTGPWASDDERKSSLDCALHTAIRRIVDALGFDFGGTTPSRNHVMAVYYHEDNVVPKVPEWLRPLLLVETHRGFGYYCDFGERKYVELA